MLQMLFGYRPTGCNPWNVNVTAELLLGKNPQMYFMLYLEPIGFGRFVKYRLGCGHQVDVQTCPQRVASEHRVLIQINKLQFIFRKEQ